MSSGSLLEDTFCHEQTSSQTLKEIISIFYSMDNPIFALPLQYYIVSDVSRRESLLRFFGQRRLLLFLRARSYLTARRRRTPNSCTREVVALRRRKADIASYSFHFCKVTLEWLQYFPRQASSMEVKFNFYLL